MRPRHLPRIWSIQVAHVASRAGQTAQCASVQLGAALTRGFHLRRRQSYSKAFARDIGRDELYKVALLGKRVTK
jgi:hypothetical protein